MQLLVAVIRFVGVMANIFDCLSKARGSIPLQTAKLLSSVMTSILVFEANGDSSNLSLITNVGSSLFGKASVCATEEKGSIPSVNQIQLIIFN
jgi:uncharacterized membrane protein YadS